MKMLETERLILRRWQESDADVLYNICLDKEVRNSGICYYNSIQESLDTILIWKDCNDKFAIVDKFDKSVIGLICLGEMNRYEGYKELEFAIKSECRGKGYGAEAVCKIIDYAFDELNIKVIAAWVRSHNKASSRLMEKCAFVHEGTLRQHARDKSDTLCFSILKDEWDANKEIAYYNALPCIFDDFISVPELKDGNIHLVCIAKKPAIPEKKYVPAYVFAICKGGEQIGELNLRIGYKGFGSNEGSLYYVGQIGYSIDEKYRGNGYAVTACRLVLPVVKAHGMTKLLITNDVNNTASRRVCEKLGLKHIRVARLPEWTDLYKDGQRFLNIYEWSVE